jgi:penicillin-insensitive murein endopeptidase
VPLPADGPGYQAVDLARNRHYGHPLLVSFVTDVGRSVERERLGTLLVGDMAQPRGGPMPSGHVSHQGGLDVDLWYRLDVPPRPPQAREGIPEPSLVVGGRPDPARWTDRQVELVRLAALDPRVARVFVGAALKRDLCQREAASPDRGWLRVVRPWPGHDDHLHVRLRCPAGSPACIGQPSLPPGDGCSPVELDAAVARERAQSRRPPPVPRQILPPACRSVLAAAL